MNNSATAVSGTVKNNVADTKAETPKPAAVKALSAAKQSEGIMPLDDRLFRLNQLFHLQQKYDRFQSSLIKLDKFVLKGDNEMASITIYDDNRNSFSTGNKEIIAELVDFLRKRIKEKIKELEPKLTW